MRSFKEESIRWPWCKKIDIGFYDRWSKLLQGCNIIQDPKTPAIGANDQVVEMLLDGKPVHWGMREVVLERNPIFTIIEGDVESILCSQVEQALAHRIFPYAVCIAQLTLGNI